MKCKCGAELEGRARLCEACKAESRRLREERGKKQLMEKTRLGRKGRAAPVAGPRPFVLHSEELPTALFGERPMWPEPKDGANSLGHVVWEIELINRYRRGKGIEALSYGRYIQQREAEATKKELAAAKRCAGIV